MTLFDGDVNLEEQRKIREQIRERWDKLGLMECVGEINFESLMELYEAQARVLVEEAKNK